MAIHDAGMFTVKKSTASKSCRMSSTAIYVPVRLLKRYRQLEPLGMNNQSRGRAGNRLLPTSLTDQALRIIREHYREFGPTLAREKLDVDDATSRLMHLLFVKSESTD
ncbi:hypothetical protein [Salmonella enterica]|uniref:hypothetical protein n=1 Tax=Salmonella enterica TaxID=28901 RepID=UPI003EBA37C8